MTDAAALLLLDGPDPRPDLAEAAPTRLPRAKKDDPWVVASDAALIAMKHW